MTKQGTGTALCALAGVIAFVCSLYVAFLRVGMGV